MPDLAIVNIRQLLTLSGPARPRTGPEMRQLGIVPDAALFVRDGAIHSAGPASAIQPLITAATDVVDAGGRIVLPGFVDAHTHPIFAGNRADEFELRIEGRTYAEIAAAGGGIRSTVRRTRAASEDDLLEAARRYRDWFLRGGTTTIEAKSGYGLSLEGEMKSLRAIRRLGAEGRLRCVPTFLGAHETPDEFRGRTAEYAEVVANEMLPAVAREGLAEYCDIFCEPSVFTPADARPILDAARALGLGLRLHADQFTPDYASALAASLHAATADHLEATTPAGLEALRAAGVQPVLLPASVYALGLKQYAAARTMIDMGMPVVVATDFNPGSSPTASMPMVLSLACSQMRMTPAEAITACTVNAAYSVGRGAVAGTLEPGRPADFAIHDCADYREVPYFFGRETARCVYIDGRRAYPR